MIWPSNRDLGDVWFSVSPILTGAGIATAGVAIIRAGVWAQPSRFLPLTLGLYTILVLIPVMIASGGPPAPLALWTIEGWDMLWFVRSVRCRQDVTPRSLSALAERCLSAHREGSAD